REHVAAAVAAGWIDRRDARRGRGGDEARGRTQADHRGGRGRLRHRRGARGPDAVPRAVGPGQSRRRRVGRQHRSLDIRRTRRRLPSTMTRYTGRPPLPQRINRLEELAVDLWWSWHPEAREVFRRLDYTSWRVTAHNPVLMLRLIAPEKLEAAAGDPEFVRLY